MSLLKSLPDGLGLSLITTKVVNTINIPLEYENSIDKRIMELMLGAIDNFDKSGDHSALYEFLIHEFNIDQIFMFYDLLSLNTERKNYCEILRPEFARIISEIDYSRIGIHFNFHKFFSMFWFINDHKTSIAMVEKALKAFIYFFFNEKNIEKNFNEELMRELRHKRKNTIKVINNFIEIMFPAEIVTFENIKVLEFLAEDSNYFMINFAKNITVYDEYQYNIHLFLNVFNIKLRTYLNSFSYNLFNIPQNNRQVIAEDNIKNDKFYWAPINSDDDYNKYKTGESFMVESLSVFEEKFHKETQLLFKGDFPWDKAIVAGGLIERLFGPNNIIPDQSDIDIFVFGKNDVIKKNFESVMDWIDNFTKNTLKTKLYVVVKASVISVYIQGFKRKIQVVVRQNTTPADIIAEFDISAIKIYYNGSGVYTNWEGYKAMRLRAAEINIRDSSLYRCMKTMYRGYYIKKFDWTKFSNAARKMNYRGETHNDKYMQIYMELENTISRESKEFKVIFADFIKKYCDSCNITIGSNDMENRIRIMAAEAVNNVFGEIAPDLSKKVYFNDNFRSSYNNSIIENFNINSFILRKKNTYFSNKDDVLTLSSFATGPIITARRLQGKFYKKIPAKLMSDFALKNDINNLASNDNLLIFIVDLAKSNQSNIVNKNDTSKEEVSEIIDDSNLYTNFINDINNDEFVLGAVSKDRRCISYFDNAAKNTYLIFLVESYAYSHWNVVSSENKLINSSYVGRSEMTEKLTTASHIFSDDSSINFKINFEIKYHSNVNLLVARVSGMDIFISKDDNDKFETERKKMKQNEKIKKVSNNKGRMLYQYNKNPLLLPNNGARRINNNNNNNNAVTSDDSSDESNNSGESGDE